MRLRLRTCAIVGLAVAAVHARHAAAGSDFERWMTGGWRLVGGPIEARAVRVVRSLTRAAETPALRVHVVDAPDVGAFSWPDGDVVVTAGLMDLLDDDELAAALAHEAGHLIGQHDGRNSARLVGASRADEAEAAADRAGIQVLSEAGRDPHSMRRMLVKVRAALGADVATSTRLMRRVEKLDAPP